jgi:hypothetical protein
MRWPGWHSPSWSRGMTRPASDPIYSTQIEAGDPVHPVLERKLELAQASPEKAHYCNAIVTNGPMTAEQRDVYNIGCSDNFMNENKNKNGN